ncbi:MAG: sugar phosphate isomerase/epimerase family protein [Myxococcota bacterium]
MSPALLGSRDLVLCAGTLPQVPFQKRVAAAAEGGFSAISLFASDYFQARREGLSDADLRRTLADFGIAVAELDPLMRWIPDLELGSEANEQGAAFFRYAESDFYTAAEALGARSINAVLVTDATLAVERIAEAFASLCDRAAAHGLLVHLEFLPWTQIPNLKSALEIAQLADRKNGGIMLDSWHHFRSGAGDEALRNAPGERVMAVQLSDAPEEPEANLVEETTRRRLLPGEGAIDLVELVRSLDAIDSTAPIGVEIFSDELAAKSPIDAARRAGAAARSVLAHARG